jgi:hypothetical protein
VARQLGAGSRIPFDREKGNAGRARDSFITAALVLLHFDLALKNLEPRLQKPAGDFTGEAAASYSSASPPSVHS